MAHNGRPVPRPDASTGDPERRLTRRSTLGIIGGGTLAMTVGAAATGIADGTGVADATRIANAAVKQERQRVVIVGGGIAGVAAAWLLDGVHDVVLLEAAPELGGHVRTIDVPVGGRNVPVDAGASFFGPKSHPVYWKLLTEVLRVPTVSAPMNVTVSKFGDDRPVIVSPDNRRVWPLLDPRFWGALTTMAIFTDRGRRIIEQRDWTTTAEQFINSLPVLPSLRDDLLFPLCGSLFGFSVPQVRAMSAHSVVAFVVRGLGDGFLAPYDYHNAVNGLRSVVSALHTGLTTVTTHVSARATGISRQDGVYHVRDNGGRTHFADHVVLALPPHAAGPLVGQLPGSAPIVSAYNRFTYIPARLAIHTDTIYMPHNRAHWSGFNVLADGPFCEPTMWLGTFGGVDLFKSWVSHRREQPRETLATVDYLHAYETPDFARAQTDLGARQGDQGLWFAGTHMTDVASQESGLLSAVTVARRLAPTSPNLARLAPPA